MTFAFFHHDKIAAIGAAALNGPMTGPALSENTDQLVPNWRDMIMPKMTNGTGNRFAPVTYVFVPQKETGRQAVDYGDELPCTVCALPDTSSFDHLPPNL